MRIPVILALASLTLVAQPAQAGKLRDTLSTLYGGDGITLRNSGVFNHAAHFTEESLDALNEFSSRALRMDAPMISVDGGAVFEYDPVVDDFVEVPGVLGSLFAERPQPLGKGRFTMGFNYSDRHFQNFEGHDLSGIQVELGHVDLNAPGVDVCIGGPPGACYTFERDHVEVELDIDLQVRALALYADYGLTDRIDVGIIVPMVRTELDVVADAHVHTDDTSRFLVGRVLHAFDPAGLDGDAPHSEAHDRATGLGDVLLRGKYALYAGEQLSLSVVSHLRLPTGDYKNLAGTGRWGGRTALLASSLFRLGEQSTISPHVNLAFDLNNTIEGTDQLQLTAGLDYGFHLVGLPSSVSVDVLHRSSINRRSGGGDDVTDLAVGYKWRMGDRSSGYIGTRWPLDRQDGLRPDVAIEIGGQLSF